MTGSTHISFLSICFFFSFNYFATSSENNTFFEIPNKNSLDRDLSHENMHSLSTKASDIEEQSINTKTANLGLNQDPHKTIKRILNYTDNPLPESVLQNNSKVIATEGGSFSLSSVSTKKADLDNITLIHNITSINNSLLTTSSLQTSSGKKVDLILPVMNNISVKDTKSKFNPITSTSESYSSVSPATVKKNKRKPIFTMVPSEEENIDSFIESSTTGRDFVLPIVLCILALPLVGYIAKLIYRRGTEFTERQQYHRMYLIDGMYNSR